MLYITQRSFLCFFNALCYPDYLNRLWQLPFQLIRIHEPFEAFPSTIAYSGYTVSWELDVDRLVDVIERVFDFQSVYLGFQITLGAGA